MPVERRTVPTFTVFAEWPDGEADEVDVEAHDEDEARAKATAALAAHPGGDVVAVVEQV